MLNVININFNYFSEILQKKTSATVMLPDASYINKPLPVMYLLHGYCGDHTDWAFSGNIEQFALKHNVAIVMPSGNNSFYADMKHGSNYLKHIGEELPQIINKVFPVSTKREDTVIAGLSMGGYGAIKIALNYTDRFSAAASFSGVLGLTGKLDVEETFPDILDCLKTCFGEELVIPEKEDIYWLADKLDANVAKDFKLYIACGTEDFFMPVNENFYDKVKDKFPVIFKKELGGHTWEFWQTHVQGALKMFFD